jgi:hypothetical protein
MKRLILSVTIHADLLVINNLLRLEPLFIPGGNH